MLNLFPFSDYKHSFHTTKSIGHLLLLKTLLIFHSWELWCMKCHCHWHQQILQVITLNPMDCIYLISRTENFFFGLPYYQKYCQSYSHSIPSEVSLGSAISPIFFFLYFNDQLIAMSNYTLSHISFMMSISFFSWILCIHITYT